MKDETYEETAERLREGKKGGKPKKRAKEKEPKKFPYPECKKKSCFANVEGKCIILLRTYDDKKCPFYKKKGGEKENVNTETDIRGIGKGQRTNSRKRFDGVFGKCNVEVGRNNKEV